MAKLNLDLERENNGLSSPSMVEGNDFPRLHLEGDDSLTEQGLPERGTMTVEYEIVREVEEKRNGKDWYSCDIEIRKIISAKKSDPASPTKSGSEAGDALDKLAAEYKESD